MRQGEIIVCPWVDKKVLDKSEIVILGAREKTCKSNVLE